MIRLLLWTIVAAAVGIALVIYWSRPPNHLDVTPDARREINDAKHR